MTALAIDQLPDQLHQAKLRHVEAKAQLLTATNQHDHQRAKSYLDEMATGETHYKACAKVTTDAKVSSAKLALDEAELDVLRTKADVDRLHAMLSLATANGGL